MSESPQSGDAGESELDIERKVTPIELFFDLVFVFAITQVTALMADIPTATGLVQGLVVLGLVWWAWTGFAWLGNVAPADEGVVRVAIVAAMVSMFVLALALPDAYFVVEQGVIGPLVFVGAYIAVRIIHAAAFSVVSRGDAVLRHQLVQFITLSAAAWALLIAGVFTPAWVQLILWTAALFLDYLAASAGGGSGWRLPSPAHFSERHGLMIIIALGESIVAVGLVVTEGNLTAPVLLSALLGMGITVCLWWFYFDVVARVSEQVLARASALDRVRLARDSFSYLHFPMVFGIVLVALGLKKAIGYIDDGKTMSLVPAFALFGGIALYLVTLSALRRRNLGLWNRQRLVAAVVLLACVPLAVVIPAALALVLALIVTLALALYELRSMAEARAALRSSH